MIEHNPDTSLFKQQMRNSLQHETKNASPIMIAKDDYVYKVGEAVEMVYFIESGQVKLATDASAGKECLLAIHGSGDVFGELCLAGSAGRQESAMAMEDTFLKQVPCARFLERLSEDALLEGFVKLLTLRVADQQKVIANLVTVDSEQRLGETLLQIARKLDKKDPRSN